MKEVKLEKRCDRNRKRSKRRPIYCLVHGCCIDSVSQKYTLFAEHAGQLQQRGMGRKTALMVMSTRVTVGLKGEWLEAFWCNECQKTKWYLVQKHDLTYELSIAPSELWQQVSGVIQPHGNPSVGEFTLRQSRMTGFNGIKDFNFFR